MKSMRFVEVTHWNVIVEKVIVHRDGTITFAFYNGASIRTEKQAA